MVKRKTNKAIDSLSLTRVTRTVYFILAVYGLSIVIFDAGNLIVRDSIINRWLLLTFVLSINTLAWYVAAAGKNTLIPPALVTLLLTLSLLILAGLNTYWERGMASTSTLLYILPLLTVATLKNRHALLAVAVLTAGTYTFAAVKYFNDFFNEGYRVQLWGNVVLYSGIIFASAWLIMILVGLRHDSK